MTTKKESNEDSRKESKTTASSEATSAEQEEHKSDFWTNVGDTAGKGLDSLKKGVEKVTHIAGSGAQLAKLKFEIHHHEHEREKLNHQAGQKLWQMQKDKQLGKVESEFAVEFKEMADLQKQIAAKEKQVEAISLVE